MADEITPDEIKKNGKREHFHNWNFASVCRDVQVAAKKACTEVEIEGDIYVFYWMADKA